MIVLQGMLGTMSITPSLGQAGAKQTGRPGAVVQLSGSLVSA
jgi:hypothetical protein